LLNGLVNYFFKLIFMTFKENTNDALGTGLYSIPDVAFILDLPKGKVRRWIKDFWKARLNDDYSRKYSSGEGSDNVVHFHTLIEFYVFYQLRQLKISTSQIINAYHTLAEELSTPYPFASSKVLLGGGYILFMLNNSKLINGDVSKQMAVKEIIQSFSKKIEFSNTEIASCYYPMGIQSHVIVDPHHQFGQPTIKNTNILAQVIADLYDAGESTDFLSRLYQLPIKEIEDAIYFFSLRTAA
jgi:uncharacterized protein (DUF433 family)